MSNEFFSTPVKNSLKQKVIIPPSPFLKTLGFGTGVKVYEFRRSPLADKLRSPWAIKKISRKLKDTELKKRLHSEAEILKKLNHPNIVGFRGYMESVRGDMLAMEECTTSLGDLIEQKRDIGELSPYSVNIILKVGYDISSALNYLHNIALLLHCDIKSFNILVKNDFAINKLCDFGVCLPLKKNGTINEIEAGEEYEYVGTLAWTAPEVLKFPQEITTKADVYSFGLVLYEMLTLCIPMNDEILNSEDISDEGEENETNCSFAGIKLDLPDIDFGEEYNIILELMYRCASHEVKNRPNTKDLENIFRHCLNHVGSC